MKRGGYDFRMQVEGCSGGIARAAEQRVRSAGSGSLEWAGARLTSHFQPIFAVREPACRGYEALLRAADAAGEALSPIALFSQASHAHRPVLDWSCRALHLRNYARFEPDHRTLFLNLHPEAIAHDAGCATELGELVRYYGLAPKHVCIEVGAQECDESALIDAVAIYRALGLAIAIDDFGRGRSNFERVLALKPELVKLDRALVADALLGWGRARRMLSGMVELLHEVRARVAITGIETAAQARVAIEAGADLMQGFYFSPPGTGLADEPEALARLAAVLRAGGRRVLAVVS